MESRDCDSTGKDHLSVHNVSKWVLSTLVIAGGCWGLTVLYSGTAYAAKVYRPELNGLASLANVMCYVFPCLLTISAALTIRRRFIPGTISIAEHLTRSVTFGLAFGFLMSGLVGSKTPVVSDVAMVLNGPATYLTVGWFSLGFGPHGDAGWALLFWMPVLQWTLLVVTGYSIWLWRQRRKRPAEQGAAPASADASSVER